MNNGRCLGGGCAHKILPVCLSGASSCGGRRRVHHDMISFSIVCLYQLNTSLFDTMAGVGVQAARATGTTSMAAILSPQERQTMATISAMGRIHLLRPLLITQGKQRVV